VTWILERGIERLAHLLARMTAGCLRHRGLVLALAALLCAWLGVGVARLDSVSSIRGFMPADDPELASFDRFLSEFPSDSGILVAIKCRDSSRCRSVLEPQMLEALGELEAELWGVEGVATVTGLWSAPTLDSDGDTITPRYLSEVDLTDRDAVESFIGQVMSEPLLNGAVIAGDAATAGILLEGALQSYGESSQQDRKRTVDSLLAIASRFEAATGTTVYVVGPAVGTELAGRNTRADLRLIMPLLFGAVLLTFAWIFRGLVVSLAPVVAVGISTLLAFGLMGHAGVPITTVSSVLPTLIIVIGVTDAMHLLTRYFHHRDREELDAEALVLATRELGVPSLVTALTGSAGLLSFALGPMPRLQEFGVFAAIGVMGGFLATFTILPVLIVLLPPASRPRPGLALAERVLDAIRVFSLQNTGKLLLTAALVTVLAFVGIHSLKVQNEMLELLDENDYVYRSEVFVRDNLRPTRTLEVIFEAPAATRITDPGALRELAAVEALLLEQPQVARVDSVLDLLRRVGSLLELPSSDASGLPESSGQSEEALFLLESAVPQVLQSFVSVDRKLVRLSGGFLYSDTRRDLATIESVRRALPELAPSWTASVTGTTSLSVRLSELILETQIASFSGAFVTIFAILAVLVGSIRLALLGMIPNLLPVAAILGLMGGWGIRLDVGTAMVASILIGISVDDTVYFLVHYRDARRVGLDLSDSIKYTFAFSGKAAIFASVILAGGFMLLTFSRFQTLAYFGLLCTVAVIAALICELFLLPAVLDGSTRLGQGYRSTRSVNPR
jgi:predicted RND superfamily exporter protein